MRRKLRVLLNWIGLGLGMTSLSSTPDAGSCHASVCLEQLAAYPDADGLNMAFSLADLNNDNTLDVIFVNRGSGVLSAFFNDGTGHLGSRVTYNSNILNSHAITAADFDGDHDIDIAVSSQQDAATYIYSNDGTGSFSPSGAYGSPVDPTDLEASDVDGDGDQDIVMGGGAGWQPNVVRILVNDGAGAFTVGNEYAVSGPPWDIEVVDCNGDGRKDLVAGATILKNIGNAAFLSIGDIDAEGDIQTVASGDLDGDGDNDLVVGNFWTGTYGKVVTLRNSGSGQFNLTQTYTLVGNRPLCVRVADFDNDSDIDVVVGMIYEPWVTTLENPGNGLNFIQAHFEPGAGFLSIGDMDKDGRQDVVGFRSWVTQNQAVLVFRACGQAPPLPPIINSILDPGTGTDLVLEWSHPNPSAVTDFEIGYSTTPGVFTAGSIPNIPVTQPFKKRIPSLIEGTRYYVGIRAHNATTGLWSEWAPAPHPKKPTIPVVLVHGLKSGPEVWDSTDFTQDVVGWLTSEGFNHIWNVDNLDPCGVPGEKYFGGNAANLSAFIESKAVPVELSTQIAIPAVNIIGHSMGGLIARRYLSPASRQNCDNPVWVRRQVKNLIMLGTPNGGSKVASWLSTYLPQWSFCDDGPAVRELSQGGMQDFNSCYYQHGTTKFYVVSGWGGHVAPDECEDQDNCCSLGGSAAVEACPNDGVVSRASVRSVYYVAQRHEGWCHGARGDESGFSCSYRIPPVSTYYRDYNLFQTFMRPILSGVTVSSAQATLENEMEDTSTPQTFVVECDSTEIGQLDSIRFVVEPGTATVNLYSTDHALNGFLRSPSGVLWDSTAAEADSMVSFSRGDYGVSFVFAEIEQGEWNLLLDASAVTEAQVWYCLIGTTESPVQSTASTSHEFAEVGDTVFVNLEITDAMLPITTASVGFEAKTSLLDQIHTDSLFDDGLHGDGAPSDGLYGGSFVADVPGVVNIVINASGLSQSQVPFERHLLTEIYVLDGAILPGDMNLDEIYDVLDVVGLIDHVFRNYPPPFPALVADVNCDEIADVLDVVSLINHVFRNGPQPTCP